MSGPTYTDENCSSRAFNAYATESKPALTQSQFDEVATSLSLPGELWSASVGDDDGYPDWSRN